MPTAESRYRALEGDRNYYLERARTASRLTIPYLIPSSNEPTAGNRESYPVPWNGIGARGVLNLASRMLLALLPPTQQFFRFSLNEAALAEQGVDPAQKSSFEEALSKIVGLRQRSALHRFRGPAGIPPEPLRLLQGPNGQPIGNSDL